MLTKLGIIKTWTNIQLPSRFNLGFWQTSKQIYRKLQYKQKVFEEFQALPCFPRKIVLYSSTNFGNLKLLTNIPWLRRFDLCFWQASKQIFYWELQYRENVFGDFQGLPRFSRKMVLYLSTTFGNLKPLTNIPWLRRSDLCIWQAPKQIYGELHIGKKLLELSKVCLAFPEKWFCICRPNLVLSSLKTILNCWEDLI